MKTRQDERKMLKGQSREFCKNFIYRLEKRGEKKKGGRKEKDRREDFDHEIKF